MAIYSTFFLCKPEELPAGFPGWRLPLPQPVRREFKNPFTGQMSVIETREPEWPDEEEPEPVGTYQVVSIPGRYEDYLEDRLPPFVRTCPHWAAKGLTEVELGPLVQAAGARSALEQAIYGPPSANALVEEVPWNVAAKLALLDEGGLQAVASSWAGAMSAPEHTHSVTGQRLYEGWTLEDALSRLGPIVALARKATDGQRMYLLNEW